MKRRDDSPVPLLSMVEVCAAEAHRQGRRRLALLGTRFTMEASFYPSVCARFGISVVPPDPVEREWIHARCVGELLRGEFKPATREAIAAVVCRLHGPGSMSG